MNDRKSKIPSLKRAIAAKQHKPAGVDTLISVSEIPAPWFVSDNHPKRSAIRICDKYGRELALMLTYHGDPDTRDADSVVTGDTKRMAAARLMAAAPAMYHALKGVFDLLNNPDAHNVPKVQKSVIDALVEAGHDSKALQARIHTDTDI